MEDQVLFIISIILGIGIILLSFFTWKLYKKLHRLSAGKNTQNLESIILDSYKKLEDIMKQISLHDTKISRLNDDMQSSIRHVGVIRFNPYKETGGSQSFAIALTNQKKSGVVLSSLYSRDHIHIFAKPIIDGHSEYTLTKEEQKALDQSLL